MMLAMDKYLPRIFREPIVAAKIKGATVLDYGAGNNKAAEKYVRRKGGTYLAYEPYRMSFWDNCISLMKFERAQGPKIVICSNVLNDITDDEELSDVIKILNDYAREGATVAISIYEGDIRYGNKMRVSLGKEIPEYVKKRDMKFAEYLPLLQADNPIKVQNRFYLMGKGWE